VRALLDTHALLWWWAADGRLGSAARRVIADPANEIFVSPASVWEIATKHRIGKLPEAARFLPGIERHISRSNFTELPISLSHAALAGSMAGAHRDPFDRMLVAQARLEALAMISADRMFAGFGVAIVWDGPPQ
jgi:PIN domain nuclease of toxin-antitoxin system